MSKMRSARSLRLVVLTAVALSVVTASASAQNLGIFVSSEASNGGSFMGLAGADRICNTLGAGAFLGSGPWVAWLSDSKAGANTRIAQPPVGGSYVQASTPGTVIAKSFADLTKGNLLAPVAKDERGNIVAAKVRTWTATTLKGTLNGASCNDWRSASATDASGTGNPSVTDQTWTQSTLMKCNSKRRFYCVGPLAPTKPPQNTWARLPDITTPQGPGKGRYGAVAFSIGGKGYLGTGSEDGVDQNDFWEFEPVTKNWQQKDPFPGIPRQYAAGFAIGDKGYVGTGSRGGEFYEYDPKANAGSGQWRPRTPFPGTPRSNAVGFAIGPRGYIGTGSTGPGSALSDFWEYDPSLDNYPNPPGPQSPWTRKADLGVGIPGSQPVLRSAAIGFSVGRYGYVGTGTDGSLRNYAGDFWRYDPDNDTWASIAPFIGGGLIYGTGFGTATKGYAFEPNSGRFYEYDPGANSWIARASPVVAKPRNSAVSFSIGNIGYYGTGYDYSYIAEFWEYTP